VVIDLFISRGEYDVSGIKLVSDTEKVIEYFLAKNRSAVPADPSSVLQSAMFYDSTAQKWKYKFHNGTTWTVADLGSGGGGASFPLNYVIDDQGDKSGTVTHDLSASTAHKLRFKAIGACTIAFSNYPSTGNAIDWYVEVEQNATGYAITWPSEIINPPVIPTTPNTVSLVALHTHDGGTIVRAITLLNASATAGNFANKSLSNINDPITFPSELIMAAAKNIKLNGNKLYTDTGNTTSIEGTSSALKFNLNSTFMASFVTAALKFEGGVNCWLNGNNLFLDTAQQVKIKNNGSTIEFYPNTSLGMTLSAFQLTLATGVGLTLNEKIHGVGSQIDVSTTNVLKFLLNATNEFELNTGFAKFKTTNNFYTIELWNDDSTPTNGDVLGNMTLYGNNSIASKTSFVNIVGSMSDKTSGSEKGKFEVYTRNGANINTGILIDSTSFFWKEAGTAYLQFDNSGQIGWPATGVGHSLTPTTTALKIITGATTDQIIFDYGAAGTFNHIFKKDINSFEGTDGQFTETFLRTHLPATPFTIAQLLFKSRNTTPADIAFADITVDANTRTAGAEDGRFTASFLSGGTGRNIIDAQGGGASLAVLYIGDNGGGFETRLQGTKIGFFDGNPVAKQTGGALTAGATYTATEQGMLNALWTAMRAYKLLT